ncbi:DUF6493 family protein [Streptomyces sp. NPDC000594]|uniref:DUF7824 domain-containing protein n=1 Tax=Streptomyces sp. NPDC000594 TaxID=3154261 RepID=UPI003333E499
MNEIMDAVRRGRLQELTKLLAPLTTAERKALLPELKTLRTTLRDGGWEDWESWQQLGKARMGLLVAGAACHTGAAAAAAWIGARDLRVPRGPAEMPLLPHLVEVLSTRETVWLGDLAHRLAARASTGDEDYPLIRQLVNLTRCPVPTSDAYVIGWALHLTQHRGLMRGLALEPEASVLVTRLFELPELPGAVLSFAEPDKPHHWPQALARLPESAMPRTELADSCVSRLLRGGRPQDLRFVLTVLKQLALTPEEEAARIPDWMGMAADSTSPVAAHAQGVLGALALSGALPEHALAETSGAVFFRPEKKLVRDQLILLGKVLTARAHDGETEAVGTLLRAVGEAFGHTDSGVQQRALKLVARHLPTVDASVREELAGAALLLGPLHRETAAALGLVPADEPVVYEAETLPAVPARRPAGAPADSVPELLSELVAARSGRGEPVVFERVLDGLVRLAYREREPLLDAVRKSFADEWWFSSSHTRGNPFPYGITGVEELVTALAGPVPVEAVRKVHAQSTGSDICPIQGLGELIGGRLAEVAWRLRTDPLPLLLATPTWETGALDAEVLVERLREYQRLGIAPAPRDFAQALLRVAPGSGGPAAREAALLGTEEGGRLASWLEGTWPELPALQWPQGRPDGTEARPEPSWPDGQEGQGRQERQEGQETEGAGAAGLLELTARGARALADRTREALRLRKLLPAHARWLTRPVDTGHRHTYRCPDRSTVDTAVPRWAAALPHHRDAVAAWQIDLLDQLDRRGAGRWEWRWLMGSLALLAEGEGEGTAGRPLHRAVATALGAADREIRLSGVDALLVLAARRQLDPRLLGRLLGELVVAGDLKPNRLAEAIRTAAATGAHRTVWSVLAAALPVLLPVRPAIRSLGELLEVAADCAERCDPDAVSGPTPGPTQGPVPDAVSGAVSDAADGPVGRPDAGAAAGSVSSIGDHGLMDLAGPLAEVAGAGGSSARVTQAARLLTTVQRLTAPSTP